MWQKIKNIFCIVMSFLSILLFTVMLFLLRRGKTDGQGSRGDSERDSRIQEGIGRCQDGTARCEEHLRRAEEILRNAINRSKGEEPDS